MKTVAKMNKQANYGVLLALEWGGGIHPNIFVRHYIKLIIMK